MHTTGAGRGAAAEPFEARLTSRAVAHAWPTPPTMSSAAPEALSCRNLQTITEKRRNPLSCR